MMSDILFSMTQNEELAAKIVRIASPDDVNEFRTELLSYDAKGEGSLNWREAWQDKETQLWSVIEYHRTNAGQRLQTPVMSSVCFFDALHSCATFERDRKIEGAAIATELFGDDDTKNMLHHIDAAELAGQPHDNDNMLHPAVNGRVLTIGEVCFDDHAYSVAKQTRERDLLPVTALAANDNMLALLKTEQSSNLSNLSNKDIMVQGIEDASLRQTFKKAVDKGGFLLGSLEDTLDYDFRRADLDDIIMNAIITLGILPLRNMIGKNSVYSCSAHFKSHHRQFNRLVKKLPDCKETDLLKEFSKAALNAFYMEYAVCRYRDYKNNNKSAATLKKGLALVEKAAHINDLPEADILRLKKAYMEGNYKNKNIFWFDLKSRFASLEKALAPVF